jgi:hypothetical protein
MDSKFSLGLIIAFIFGGVGVLIGLLGHQLWIAIGFFVVASILAFLFICPKSPVRRRCLSVSSRLGIVLIKSPTIVRIGDKYLTIHVGLRAISDIQVDKIELKIGRNSLLSDWKSSEIQGDESRYINFTRPNWLCKGQYEAYLVTYTPDGTSKSEKFPVKVDEY